MHKIILFIIVSALLILHISCTTKDAIDIMTIDVTKKYPEKNIYLHDIAEIEYLTLETEDNFLYSYIIGISESFIICGNHFEKSFVFFSRTSGKPISKIARHGEGPEEYNIAAASVYSEENDEFFILDYPIGIKVYGRDGTYKRALEFRERSYIGGPEAFYDFDEYNLMYYDGFQGSFNNYPTSFVLVSKQDGRTTKEIKIPYEKKISLMFTRKSDENAIIGSMPKVFFAVRNGNDYLLTEYSADTVYRYTQENGLIPVLVRKPSIQEMHSKIILHSWLEIDKYIFLSTSNLEVDRNEFGVFQDKGYLIEKSTGNIFQSHVHMNDYKGKDILLNPSVLSRSLNSTKTGFLSFHIQELLKANKDKKLSGKLKEKVEQTIDEDGHIIMILYFNEL